MGMGGKIQKSADGGHPTIRCNITLTEHKLKLSALRRIDTPRTT